MPDMTDTVQPKSDQLDNLELRDGPQIFTVTSVDLHIGADQPVHVHLAEFPRPWKPGKNQRRVLKHCWGKETDDWHGQRVELYADTSVKFGNDTPGGTRIRRISGIESTQHVPILLGQGKPGTFKVEPLPDLTPIEQKKAEWRTATPERRAEIEAEVAAIEVDA